MLENQMMKTGDERNVDYMSQRVYVTQYMTLTEEFRQIVWNTKLLSDI